MPLANRVKVMAHPSSLRRDPLQITASCAILVAFGYAEVMARPPLRITASCAILVAFGYAEDYVPCIPQGEEVTTDPPVCWGRGEIKEA